MSYWTTICFAAFVVNPTFKLNVTYVSFETVNSNVSEGAGDLLVPNETYLFPLALWLSLLTNVAFS